MLMKSLRITPALVYLGLLAGCGGCGNSNVVSNPATVLKSIQINPAPHQLPRGGLK